MWRGREKTRSPEPMGCRAFARNKLKRIGNSCHSRAIGSSRNNMIFFIKILTHGWGMVNAPLLDMGIWHAANTKP